MKVRYIANITAGALLVSESRKIADLMIREVSVEEWKDAIENKNILQKLSVSSSKRVASFIRARLGLMTPELWIMVRDGDAVLATQAIFAAAIKHCRILGDDFILSCKQRDSFMQDFPPSTAKKMRSVTHKILAEAGYLQSPHCWKLKRVEIVPEVMEYLIRHNEEYVCKC